MMSRLTLILLLLTITARAQQMLGFSYDISVPTGDTRIFIPVTSMLGFGLEGRQMNYTNTSIGVNFHWNVFKESGVSRVKKGRQSCICKKKMIKFSDRIKTSSGPPKEDDKSMKCLAKPFV